ncbi:MAG: hypothetical protein HUU60_00820 [Armatimonadetes bacterium]|nr:hypothetical protein [Armatimonadota bacterium]
MIRIVGASFALVVLLVGCGKRDNAQEAYIDFDRVALVLGADKAMAPIFAEAEAWKMGESLIPGALPGASLALPSVEAEIDREAYLSRLRAALTTLGRERESARERWLAHLENRAAYLALQLPLPGAMGAATGQAAILDAGYRRAVLEDAAERALPLMTKQKLYPPDSEVYQTLQQQLDAINAETAILLGLEQQLIEAEESMPLIDLSSRSPEVRRYVEAEKKLIDENLSTPINLDEVIQNERSRVAAPQTVASVSPPALPKLPTELIRESLAKVEADWKMELDGHARNLAEEWAKRANVKIASNRSKKDRTDEFIAYLKANWEPLP